MRPHTTTTTGGSTAPRTDPIPPTLSQHLFPLQQQQQSSSQVSTMRGSSAVLTPESSSVWQRRTNRIVAAGIIVVGLTMMISQITQCIYIGMLFIIVALIWLAWLTMKERKLEPPRPEDQPAPVLFLVTSHMLPRTDRPSVPLASDKPPSYDTIVTLDGLPPDYSTVLAETPPSYEELAALYALAAEGPIPGTSGYCQGPSSSSSSTGPGSGMDPTYSTAQHHKNNNNNSSSSDTIQRNSSSSSLVGVGNKGSRLSGLRQGADSNDSDSGDCAEASGCVGKIYKRASSTNSSCSASSSSARRAAAAVVTPPEPANRHRRRNGSSSSSSARASDAPAQQQEQTHLSPVKSNHHLESPSKSSLLRLQVPTLSRDTAGNSLRGYLARPELEDATAATTDSSVISARNNSSRNISRNNSSSNISRINSSANISRNSSSAKTDGENSSNYSVEAEVPAATHSSRAATIDSSRGLRLSTSSNNVTPVPSPRVHRPPQQSNNATAL